jgi:magnesium-protoporphyrin IX monomethyl ester (oxidative) cyclase
MACSFCGLNGVRVGYRSKSADRVLRELEELSRRHGIDRLCFVDNVLDMRFFRDVLPALQEAGAPYRIVYEVRSHLGRHHLEQLTRAGCRSMQPGIESLHDEVLKLLRKGTTTLQHVAFLKWARELGIRLAWAILCGAPGERDEWYMEMAEWLPWIAHLHPPKGAMTIRFDRFGRYHLAPSEHALRLRPMPAYSFVYPLEEAAVRDLAYFFRHSPESGTPPSWVVDPAARPGLRAVQEAVGRWKADFWSVPESERASLTATRRDGELVIEDSRPGASERSLALRGLERSIYEECDAPRTRGDLARRLAEKHQLPHGEEELDAALASLGERKLLLSMGGRHLALALRSPAVPLPDDRESAEGFVAALKVVASSAKTSLARQVALHPFDLPLVDAWRAASHAHAAAAP